MSKLYTLFFLLITITSVFAQEAEEKSDIDNHLENTLKRYSERSNDFVPEPPKREMQSVTYHVYVIDKNSQKPVKAKVNIIMKNPDGSKLQGKGNCSAAGEFLFNLASDSELEVYVTFPNYIPKMHHVNIEDISSAMGVSEITHTFELQKIAVGEYISLENINFTQGKYTLLEESYTELDQLVFLMESSPSMVIEVAGHTDNTGSKNSSLQLSEDRVKAVKDYLVSQGIGHKRIVGVGYGGTKPLVNGNSEEAHKSNRRVEFKVIKMKK